MKINKRIVVILPFFIWQLGCGSGTTDLTPTLGLFDGPTADLSTVPQDGSLDPAIEFFEGANNSGFNLDATPLSSSSTAKSAAIQTSKGFGFIESPECERTDATTRECTYKYLGSIDGTWTIKTRTHFDHADQQVARGSLLISFDFDQLRYERKCGGIVSINGILKCNLSFDMSVNEVEGTIKLQGQCHTDDPANANKKMVFNYNDQEHLIGYDLVMSHQTIVPLGEAKKVVIKDFNLDGIVSIDGVNYSYVDIKGLGLNQCQ